MNRNLFLAFIIALPLTALASSPEYTRLVPTCKDCVAIDSLLSKFSLTQDPTDRLNLALKAADLIHHISLKDKSTDDQYRLIYFSLKASVEVFDDDFDSAAELSLMDLRQASPKNFDYVFQRFPIDNQKTIVERMKNLKEDGIGPKIDLPTPKAVDSQ
jgi:hypothetical protein